MTDEERKKLFAEKAKQRKHVYYNKLWITHSNVAAAERVLYAVKQGQLFSIFFPPPKEFDLSVTAKLLDGMDCEMSLSQLEHHWHLQNWGVGNEPQGIDGRHLSFRADCVGVSFSTNETVPLAWCEAMTGKGYKLILCYIADRHCWGGVFRGFDGGGNMALGSGLPFGGKDRDAFLAEIDAHKEDFFNYLKQEKTTNV